MKRKRKMPAMRNPFVALAIKRKAGVHRKSGQAVRWADPRWLTHRAPERGGSADDVLRSRHCALGVTLNQSHRTKPGSAGFLLGVVSENGKFLPFAMGGFLASDLPVLAS